MTNDVTIGVLMLATHFPRPPGDIGNPLSFPWPVLFETVPAATAATVVTRGQISQAVIDGFITGAQRLVERGANLITTSCGFACAIHDQLAAAIAVPLVSSALNLVPELARSPAPLPVITFDGSVLSPAHFGRFWAPKVVIQGIENGRELHRVIKQDLLELDPQAACQDVLDAVAAVLHRHPRAERVLLECTNLPPYRQAIEQRFGLPVHDIFCALAHQRLALLECKP